MAFTLKESNLRAHLVKCFEQQKLTRFPRTTKLTVTRPPAQNIAIVIYCHCRRPDSYDEDMIQCDGCGLWLHYKCAKIIKAPEGDWFCLSCISKF